MGGQINRWRKRECRRTAHVHMRHGKMGTGQVAFELASDKDHVLPLTDNRSGGSSEGLTLSDGLP